jgi:putative addiction module component (TIGR02574 family)
MNNALESIAHLGKFERLQLAEDLWDEFAGELSQEPIAPSVLEEFELRSQCRDDNPGQAKTLAEIAKNLGIHV